MMTNFENRVTQGQFSFLPPLTDKQISAQIKYALKNGCDMAIGNELQANAAEALKRGLIAEADLDRAVARILRVMCRLGARYRIYRRSPSAQHLLGNVR